MEFNHLIEFEKDLKLLLKKYRSLNEDLTEIKLNLKNVTKDPDLKMIQKLLNRK